MAIMYPKNIELYDATLSEKKVFKGDIDSLRREVEKISEEFHSYISPLKSQEV